SCAPDRRVAHANTTAPIRVVRCAQRAAHIRCNSDSTPTPVASRHGEPDFRLAAVRSGAQGRRPSPEPFLLCSFRSPSWIYDWEIIKEPFLVVVLDAFI